MCEEKNRGERTGGPSTPVEKRGKGRGEKKDTPAQVQRMMKRLGLTFKGVKDPRALRGRRPPLGAMLMLLVQTLTVGKRVLRRAEELGRTYVLLAVSARPYFSYQITQYRYNNSLPLEP
jgi:hypothetical protein